MGNAGFPYIHRPKVKPEAARLKSSPVALLRYVGAGGFYLDGVEGLAGGHEEAVAFGGAEDDVAADFGEADLADFVACGVDDVDAVIAVADPARTCPDIAAFVAERTVIGAGLVVEPGVAEFLAVFEGRAVDVVDPDLVHGLGYQMWKSDGVPGPGGHNSACVLCWPVRP